MTPQLDDYHNLPNSVIGIYSASRFSQFCNFMVFKRSVQDGFRAQKYAFPLICKAFFLIFFLSPFGMVLGHENNFGIDQIRFGMDQISTGFPQNGIPLLRKGRALLFEMRDDPFYASLIELSLREEARAELMLASKCSGLQKALHLDSAEKLLKGGAPSLESNLLELELLQAQGKTEIALQKVNGWLQGEQPPVEKGFLNFAKAKLLSEDEKTLKQALSSFETVRYEGEETQSIRLILAKKAYARGELTESLRTLSKIVNSTLPSQVFTEALNLRNELLERLSRKDLRQEHQFPLE